MTVLGGALLLWIAYKVGLYIEYKLHDKAKPLETQTKAEADPEAKR